uniref:Uncharacterized protein n=1 Tax=Panagrolaimus superbus TaxID=310955 RepID=A0A914YYL7_9BILA
MTPMPGAPTFAPFPGAAVTPIPPVPARSGAPEHQQLPALATPPTFPQVEQQINQQGPSAAVSAATAGGNAAQAQGVSTLQGGQQPAAGQIPQAPQHQLFQNLPGFPPHQPFQPFTFPPHPQFQFPTHQPFNFPGFPPHDNSGGLQPTPTLPPMPTFSFPTLPPAAATTPHPLFTLPPHPHFGGQQQQQQPTPIGQTYSGPAPPPSAASATGPGPQAQGASLLSFPAGVAPIQFPGLGPIGGH